MKYALHTFLCLAIQGITLSLSATTAWDGSIAKSYSGGNGSNNSPFLIGSASELALLSDSVNKGGETLGKHYKLTTPISLNKHDWDAIGSTTVPFSGIFDGNSHPISLLNIEKRGLGESDNYQGLFGYVYNGEILNVTILENSRVVANGYTGSIVGYAELSTITNCHNKGNVIGQLNYVGGIAGYLKDCTINDCSNFGFISGVDKTGGITGESFNTTLNRCCNTQTISGNDHVGGITGNLTDFSKLYDCYNNDSIFGYNHVGGLCGSAFRFTNVGYSYNTGTVLGVDYVGGITGYGSVYTNINSCYSSADLYGYETNMGGIIAHTEMNWDFSNSYFNSECHFDVTLNSYGTAKKKEEMTTPSFLNTLNKTTGKFKTDVNQINQGFPLTHWQSDQTPTGCRPELQSSFLISTKELTATIHNTQLGETYKVYTLSGCCVSYGECNSNDTQVTLHERGVYVVVYCGVAQKIIL